MASGAICNDFDITFVLNNGVKLKANKLLVCQESRYVKCLFQRWTPKTLGQVDLTNLDFITEESMNTFLDFVKNKKLPEFDEKVCITDIFATANYLDVPNLLEKLEDHVQENISKENLIECILNARDWQFLGLERKLRTKMGHQFLDIIGNDTLKLKLLQMEKEDFSYLLNIMAPKFFLIDDRVTLLNFLERATHM